MPGFLSGGNIFTTLANATGEAMAGKQAREERLNEDALRRMQLDMQAQNLESMEKQRLFNEHEAATLHAQQRSGVTALGQYINSTLHTLGRPQMTFTGNEDLGSMETMSRDLGTAAAQIRAEQYYRSRELSQATAQMKAVGSAYNNAQQRYFQWYKQVESEHPEYMARRLRGDPSVDLDIQNQIRQRAGNVFEEYVQAASAYNNARFSKQAALGTASYKPDLNEQTLLNTLPYSMLTPDEQLQRVNGLRAAAATGKPINEADLRATGVPVDQILGRVQAGPTVAGAPAAGGMPQPNGTPVAKSLLEGDFGSAASGLGSMLNPGNFPMAPTAMMAPTPGFNQPVPGAMPAAPPAQPSFPAIPPSQMPGPSPTPGPGASGSWGGPAPIPTPQTPPAGGQPPLLGEALAGPMRPGQRPIGPGPGATIGPTPTSSLASSSAPQPPASGAGLFNAPAQLPGMHINADGNSQAGPMGQTLPTTYINAGYDAQGQYTKLRGALSAPAAEGIARDLLDHGESYDMVTASIPQPFQGLVSAKLPKRIPSLVNY